MKTLKITSWVLRIIAALILLQTLYFKFTASEESVYIFSTLGIEPWGRIGTGLLELFTAILLLVPKTTAYGALLGLGIMTGALCAHLTKLGIVVKNDGGELFLLALVVFACCAGLSLILRKQLFTLFNRS